MKIKTLDGITIAVGTDVPTILKAEVATTIRGPKRKSFRNADLRNMNLRKVEITASNNPRSQRRSDFMGSSFAGSDLRFAQFSGLDLRAADFSDCDLRGAIFMTCDLDGACFDRVAMHRHTEDRTGYYPSINWCTVRHMHARDADFSGMSINILDRDFSVPHMERPAFNANFHDCNFSRTNFNGDWTDATFMRCDLSDSWPGVPSASLDAGAVWDVYISHDSNIDGMNTHNAQTAGGYRLNPQTILPKDYVWEPDPMFDADGFEKDDGFETGSEAEREKQHEKTLRDYEAYMVSEERIKDQAAAEERARVWRTKQAAEKATKAAVVAAAKRQAEQEAEQKKLLLRTDTIRTLQPFTGTFVNPLVQHYGSKFKLLVEFSVPLSTGYADIRDHGFRVTNGHLSGAQRVDRRSDLWLITVMPASTDTVRVQSTDRLIDRYDRPVPLITVTVKGAS